MNEESWTITYSWLLSWDFRSHGGGHTRDLHAREEEKGREEEETGSEGQYGEPVSVLPLRTLMWVAVSLVGQPVIMRDCLDTMQYLVLILTQRSGTLKHVYLV